MITKERFYEIRNEVDTALKNTFKELEIKCYNEFVLLLAYAEYNEEYKNIPHMKSAYTIDDTEDRDKDRTRFKFLAEFLNKYYSFSSGQDRVQETDYQRNLEMMIYSHIWETKFFLKQLYRLSYLVKEGKYHWEVEIPDMGKHKAIRETIKENFKFKNNPLCEIISKGFHSSLRNAFAHSDYSFVTMNNFNIIALHNYKGESWELQKISFDEWSERFVYSFLLNYLLYDLIEEARKIIKPDITFEVNTKDDKYIRFRYNKSENSFLGVKQTE